MDRRVHRHVLASHRDTVSAICDAGEQVAATWPGTTVSDTDRITDPLGQSITASGLAPELLDALNTAVEATGRQLRGAPVPAPPYLVITSRGPVCRGTLDDDSRLLLEFELFAVERQPPRYRFLDPAPEQCLSVRLRGAD